MKKKKEEIAAIFMKNKIVEKRGTAILLGIGLCVLTVIHTMGTKNGLLDWITLGLVWIIGLLAIIVCLAFEKINDRQMRVLQLAGFVIAILIFSKPLIGMVIHW